MEIISNPTQVEIKKAAQALMDGHLVAFPTETVYGLGADATNRKAVSRIYSVKGRPTTHPLIVHVSSINQVNTWTSHIPNYAIKLAKEFWPGPMTLILKRSHLVGEFITGGQDSVGIRVPSDPIALMLLTEFEKLGGSGIAAPSANKFAAVSPTSADAVAEEISFKLKNKDIIIDGGSCSIGIESTIIECTGPYPRVIRPGSITLELMENLLGTIEEKAPLNTGIRASGMLEIHYAPKAKLFIGEMAQPKDGLLALSSYPTPEGVIRLASPNNLEEFARDLYKSLRFADQLNLTRIVVIPPPGDGIALAIRDRLIKASAGSK